MVVPRDWVTLDEATAGGGVIELLFTTPIALLTDKVFVVSEVLLATSMALLISENFAVECAGKLYEIVRFDPGNFPLGK